VAEAGSGRHGTHREAIDASAQGDFIGRLENLFPAGGFGCFLTWHNDDLLGIDLMFNRE
jgi:hypothetical protein